MLGPNAVLKQLEAVDEDRKEESVEDEFEDCRVDLEENADEDESEGGRCELMNRPGLVAFVKDNDDDNDKQGETDEDDPNYTPPVEKSDTEDDSSEEDDEGNESDIDDDDQEQNVTERPHKKGKESTSEDESEDDEEKNKVKRSIFGKKRGLPLGQASESESKKRKSSFDTDDNMEEKEEDNVEGKEDEDNREVDELTETQKSVLEAAEEGLYDNLDEEDPEDGFKTGRGQDPRISKGNMAEDDSSYQSDADEEGGEVCTI